PLQLFEKAHLPRPKASTGSEVKTEPDAWVAHDLHPSERWFRSPRPIGGQGCAERVHRSRYVHVNISTRLWEEMNRRRTFLAAAAILFSSSALPAEPTPRPVTVF